MYVVDFLRSRRVWFQTFLHHPASSAARLAGTAHIPGRNVAKTVMVKAGEAFALAVLPATSQVNLERFAAALRVDPAVVRLATPDEIDQTFHDCEPGTIPPFGQLYGLKTVVESALHDAGMIVLRTNARHQGLRMAFRDYEALEEPLCAQFADPIHTRPVRPVQQSHRHAG